MLAWSARKTRMTPGGMSLMYLIKASTLSDPAFLSVPASSLSQLLTMTSRTAEKSDMVSQLEMISETRSRLSRSSASITEYPSEPKASSEYFFRSSRTAQSER